MPLRDLNTTFLKGVKTGVNPIMLQVATHTLKILRCKQTKFLKYVRRFFNIMHERLFENYLDPALVLLKSQCRMAE